MGFGKRCLWHKKSTTAVDTKNKIYGHQNDVSQYIQMVNTDAAVKYQIVATFDTDYLKVIRDDETGFAGVSAW